VKRELGQALILVLILLAVGGLLIVPTLQLSHTSLKSRTMYGQSIKEDYTLDAINEYSLWKLRWEPDFASSIGIGNSSDTIEITLNGITANSTIYVYATTGLSGVPLANNHQIKPWKEVTPNTAVPGVPTTFTYTIYLQRLEPDDAVFDPLEIVKDAMDEGFVYVPHSSALDGVPFLDNDLTILKTPVEVLPLNTLPWSSFIDDDSTVMEVTPDQNYGSDSHMYVSSGTPSSNTTARSFLSVNITGIPDGAIIQSANLTLHASKYPVVTRHYNLHRVTDNWTETGINWNNQPGVSANLTGSAATPSDNNTPMVWDVGYDVQKWADNVLTNNGWRISDEAEQLYTENYTSTEIDALEFDALKGKTPSIIHISGDVYAMAYGGDGDDGFLKTVEILSSGNIIDTIIDSMEFDAIMCQEPEIIHVSGDIYAIAYDGDGDDGFLKTFRILSTGVIANQIDTLEFDILKGKTPSIIHVSGDVYAIAYAGDGDDGFLKTVEIAVNGQITNEVIDNLEFDTVRGKTPSITHVSGDFYAIAYTGGPADLDLGQLKTVEILSSGNITDTAIDTLEFDAVKGKTPDITHVSGDLYAIAYAGDGDDGFLTTVQIAANGYIAGTAIDTLEFDTEQGKTPRITHVSGDVCAVVYEGKDSDGFVKMVAIAPSGNIYTLANSNTEYDTVRGKTPDIIHVSDNIYAIAYTGGPADADRGQLKTVKIELSNYINHTTEFYTKDADDSGLEPKLIVEYIPLGGSAFQTITWEFEPKLDFGYGQIRTLSFQARATLANDERYWNEVKLWPDGSYSGMTANITVGNPPDTGNEGSCCTVTKTAEPPVVYAGIPTIVTYVISISNTDIGDFAKLDYIEDYLPPGFSYVAGSATLEWPDHNSTDNPAYQTYSLYYNIGDFEPDIGDGGNGRLKLKWHKGTSANGLFPGDNELLHDRPFPQGVTYTQTFQALADVEVSGFYQNEVFVKIKDYNLYDDHGLADQVFYSWPTGEVIVPAYDVLSETERSALRTSASITLDGIVIRSYHWKTHK